MSFDITVVGGGVIGLSCAWRMAREGARVVVLERGVSGVEASWAAAGILAAQSVIGGHSATGTDGTAPTLSENDVALRDLSLQSRALYEEFATELKEWSGVDVGLFLNGSRPGNSIQPGILHFAEEEIRFDNEEGIDEVTLAQAQEISGVDLHAPDLRCYWLPREGQVESRALLQALYGACSKAGVEVRSQTNVTGFHTENGRIKSVDTQKEQLACEQVLWAAGAWGAQAEGVPSDCLPPVFPVAGQVLALRPPRLPRCLIHASGVYLVPRRNGQLVLGATSDGNSFEKLVTSEGASRLFSVAQTLLPELKEEHIEDQWAGLRPATPDGLPILGETPLPNLSVATGHFRNGILLAPATAQLVSDHLLRGVPIPAAFRLERFHTPVGKA